MTTTAARTATTGGEAHPAPPPIEKQFDGSFIDSFPGIDAAWVVLGAMQGVIVAALAVSLVLREFLPTRLKSWLLAALCLAMLNFALLAFGQIMTSEFDSVAQLFAYFGSTVVVFAFVLLMPPYRPARWLSSLVEGRG